MAISEVCQFELKEEVDKLRDKTGLSITECIRQVIQFYSEAGVEIKEATAKSKYYRAEDKVANATNNQKPEYSNKNNNLPHIQEKSKTSDARGGERIGAGRPAAPPEIKKSPVKAVFNETNENIQWAKWSWNPVTGCNHGCKYCYARDIANRFYPPEIGFDPHFYPNRMDAPKNTVIPESRVNEPGITNVFVCSMADLFGDWVPDEWIDKVLDVVSKSKQWNFIFLTKNPSRLPSIEFPLNCAVGTTVDIQSRVKQAQDFFKKVEASVRFVSCEPLLEPLTFSDMSMFEWLIIGGLSKSTGMAAGQPEWEWVESLHNQGRKHRLKIFWKPNLTVRPEEDPFSSSF